MQGRSDTAAARLRDSALAAEQAGAELLVLECVPSELAAQIRKSLVYGVSQLKETPS